VNPSAARDPARFAEPDTFRAARSPNADVGFGAGIHACGGLLLARLEMQVALRILFQWLPEPAIDIHSL
jgi:cytochrome P450